MKIQYSSFNAKNYERYRFEKILLMALTQNEN